MTIEIRMAKSSLEREAVYRMRYQVYVLEMGRKQIYANHQDQTIRDPLDDTGLVVTAFDGNNVVGTQRINLGSNTEFKEYTDYYQMEKFGDYYPLLTSISTRLMVLPSHRNTSIPIKLANARFKIGVDAGVRFDFMDCNDHLVGYFEHLGFRRVFDRFEHPEYGSVNPLVLASLDLEHLEKCRSPFRRFVVENAREDDSVTFFRSLFDSATSKRDAHAVAGLQR